MKRNALTRIVAAVLVAAAFVGGWLFFAPAQLGGSTSYAVIVGSSMEPLLHRGDLALIRTNDSYGPGDIVLYDNAELGGKVMHRILSRDGSRFVLKGDNNDFIDSTRPTRAEVVGRLWFSVPKVGVVTEWARVPQHAAIIVGLTTLLALGGGGGATFVRHRRRGAGSAAPVAALPIAAESGPRRSRAPLEVDAAIVPLVVASAVFALLAVVAWSRPLERVETVDAAYVQQGRFTYSADVASSAAYPDGRVDTGEPVFLRLVDRVRVAFAYELTSELPLGVAGTIGLDATVADGRGWSRTLLLAPTERFTGPKAVIEGDLDLKRVRALTDRVQELTGSVSASYTVTIQPLVAVEGVLAGRNGSDTFGPTLPFDLEPVRLQVGSGAAGGNGLSPFAPRVEGVGQRTVPNDLVLGALDMGVEPARALSLGGLGASLALLLTAVGAVAVRRRGSESQRIAARYGGLLLPVETAPVPESSRIADLTEFEALARLAERYSRMILHVETEGQHTYLIEDAGAWYRYRTGERRTTPVLPPAEPPPLTSQPLAPGALIPGGNGTRYESRRSRLARIGRGRGQR